MPTARPSGIGRDRSLARLLFVGILAFWLLYPLVEQGRYAQDAIPLVVAGQLARQDPGALYVDENGGLFETKPPFFARSCRYYDTRSDCDLHAVAFVSPPAALAIVVPLSALGSGAFPLVRFVGAAALVAAMAVLWRRLTPIMPPAAWALAAVAVLLTPLMTAPISLGQSSPLLFLAAVVPVTAANRNRARAAGFGVLLGVIVALKAFPLALLAVPARHRLWKAVLWPVAIAALLSVGALLIAPLGLWRDFVVSSSVLSKESSGNPYGSSLESALGQLGVHAAAVAWLARALLAVPVALVARRVTDPDVRWACSWAVMLVLFPQVWGHYSFVLVAAIAAVLAWRPDRDRWWWALPAVAALTVPIGLLGGSGRGSPLVQLLCNLVGLGIALGIAVQPLAAEPARRPVTAGPG